MNEVKFPDGKSKACLYNKGGYRFNEYMVMKISMSADPKVAEDSIDDWELTEHEMLKSIDQSSELTENAQLVLIKNRFLVFSRGGIYFAMYDLKLNQPVFNEFEPFALATATPEAVFNYADWVKKHIDSPIRQCIDSTR